MEKIEVSAKTVEEAVTDALVKLGVTSDKIEYEVVDKGSKGFMGIGSKPAVILAWLKEEPKKSIEEVVTEFLTKVCGAMNLTVKVNITVEDKDMNIDIVGDDMGVLIGKRGQTLDSLQYLVSLVVNKEAEEFYRVKLDTENYRARRKETLENLARNIAFKVKKTRRPVSLEPMNPYERRIIHAALQGDKYVVTSSRGEDPNRYVVISFKKNNFYKDNQQ
jgi:spoIIIJ-associated protein